MIKIVLESPQATHFRVLVGDEPSGPLRLSYQTIYSLESAIPIQAMQAGVSWDIPKEALSNPLAFELMLHAAYLKVLFYFWPRTNPRSPFGAKTLPMHFDQHFHMLKNLAILNKMSHVQALAGSAKGSHVIVAMPGPSLDPEFIRRHQDSSVIIASGRAIPTLIKADVRADIYWIQDTHPPSYEVIMAGLEGDKRPGGILVANPAGPIAHYADAFDHLYKAWNCFGFETDRFEKLEEVPPSSATGAYSLAKLLGAASITFTGCDSGSVLPEERSEAYPEYYSNLLETDVFNAPEEPLAYQNEIVLRHAKSLAVRTQSNYLSCAQWLKSRAMRDRLEQDITVYDQSQTGMLTFNSVIAPFTEGQFKGASKSFRPGRFDHHNDCKPFAAMLLKHYDMIQRHLQVGTPVPGLALQAPLNSIFSGTGLTMDQRFSPDEEQYQLASLRLEQVIETLKPIASH